MENLLFGTRMGTEDADENRVYAICRRFSTNERIQEYLESSEALKWSQMFSMSESFMLCLIRALVANPQVLSLYKPTAWMGQMSALMVMDALREFVDTRGFEKEPDTKWLRRPRTCFVATTLSHGVEIADHIFHVKPTDITELSHEFIQDSLKGLDNYLEEWDLVEEQEIAHTSPKHHDTQISDA
eukprot:gnl/TRDRNA2_/TRDRNA2_177363_c0_seq10.p1 gnl/TRDRNA2_/TRDRNA2_177363_c0~~gnl/TRDRNA2_/TRDRNA2_177363_c0_seq10.p1  ORF type:complete len:185 (+),score=28.78 gnl/TRDRNA2_/TRDRNA2_177363_c0_seq10:414-968(+)